MALPTVYVAADFATPEAECPPFASSLEHLTAELSRLDLLLRIQVVRSSQAWGRTQARGLPSSEEEALSLLDRLPGVVHQWAAPELPRLQQSLQRLTEELDQRRRRSRAAGVELRLLSLAEQFELDAFELDVLLIAFAAELDAKYERLFAYLQDDAAGMRPSIDLVYSLLDAALPERLAVRERFGASARLVRNRLLRLFTDTPQRLPPLCRYYCMLDERVIDYLRGSDSLDARLCAYAALVLPQTPGAELLVPAEWKARVVALAGQPGPRILHLQGPTGSGRKTTAQTVCAALCRPLLIVRGALLAPLPDESREELVRLALREARMHDAALFWEGWDALPSDEARMALLQLLDEAAGLSFLSSSAAFEPRTRHARAPLFHIPMPRLDVAARAELWRRALAAGPSPQGAFAVDVQALAGSHRLSGGEIAEAVMTARQLAGFRDPQNPSLTMQDLSLACRQRGQPSLGTLATKVTAHSTWDDLVLSDDRRTRLREIAQRARHHSLVFETWEFDRRLPSGKGLSVLFTGPPGTGKTLAASVLANELGLDLFQIDLSSVVSKYIGETEKQLARIFAEAEGSPSILFFDEADALFGKRTETHNAHDRYANIETSFLLQRIEAHAGMVILASNLSRNIDEAFTRRIQFVLDFPHPEEAERRRIWERIFPDAMPKDPGVDLAFMARRFDLAGGAIRNVALAAAFLAAAEGQPLAQRHLLHATRREYQKMGRIVDEAMFAGGR